MSVNIYDEHIVKIKSGGGVTLGYQVIKDKEYYSKRYNKRVNIYTTDLPYDGATGVKDINSFGWLFHDVLKRERKFSDGSRCSNWQASCVLRDVLKSEKRWFRCNTWFVGTLVWGFFAG